MVQGQERSVFTNVMCALCGSSSGAIAVQFYIALRGVTLPHKTWNILSPGDIYSLLAGINRHLKQIEIEAILTTERATWVFLQDSFTCICSIFAKKIAKKSLEIKRKHFLEETETKNMFDRRKVLGRGERRRRSIS